MTSLNKITKHWTAGVYTPNNTDRQHYHYLVDDKGNIFTGKYKPEDNINCKDGKYAAHTGGGNTGNIGVAICGMWSKDYPIRRVQLEAACKLIAELATKYNIRITNEKILTHAEFGNKFPHTTSYGKIDINNLPCVAVYGVDNVGNWIRNKVVWYKSKL